MRTMTKAQVLHQIRSLTPAQCKQLEVEEPFEGEATIAAVMAWLGDSTLYGADGAPLDMDAIFAAEDPATLSLHSGMPAPAEPLAAEAEEAGVVFEEVTAVNAPAVEEAVAVNGAGMRAAVRRGVSDAIRKGEANTGRGLPRIELGGRPSANSRFKTREDQQVAAMWLGAKVWKNPEATKWWDRHGSGIHAWKGQTEGTNSAGGFLVPDPLEAAILDVISEYGVARRVCRNFPMDADTLNIPSLTSGATVYVPGEATAITESSAVWANVACVAAKRACLMKWSAEIGADALFSMSDTLSEYMGRALGIQEDTEFIQGAGEAAMGSVEGLEYTTHTAVSGAGSSWSDLTLANLVTTSGTLADKYIPGASWIMSRAAWSQIVLRVVSAAGGNTIDSLGVGTTGAQLLGYPVNFSDQAPTSTGTSQETMWFGNFSDAAVFGARSGIEIATSEHVNFAEDQIAIRATSRYDIQVHDGSAYVSLDTTS